MQKSKNSLKACFKNVNIGFYLGLNVRKPVFGVSKQQRCRPACVYPQSDQLLFYSLTGKYHILTCYKRNFNHLAGLCSWFESYLVGNQENRFSDVEAYLLSYWDDNRVDIMLGTSTFICIQEEYFHKCHPSVKGSIL